MYSGFAQSHFARPAVRALRAHMVRRILALTGAGKRSRVLSLGCGIGDTELLLAPHVGEVTGIDLSPAAIRQARADAAALGIRNARFEAGHRGRGAIRRRRSRSSSCITCRTRNWPRCPHRLREQLTPGGVFYSLDPSRQRLSGAVGRLLIPRLMKRYQTEDERELEPEATAALFRAAGWETRVAMYDFGSSPLAGLFPGWRRGLPMARKVDDGFYACRRCKRRGSNFEVIARAGT